MGILDGHRKSTMKQEGIKKEVSAGRGGGWRYVGDG